MDYFLRVASKLHAAETMLRVNALRSVAKKLQTPVSRAVVSGQRSFFGGGDDVPSDPKDLVRS